MRRVSVMQVRCRGSITRFALAAQRFPLQNSPRTSFTMLRTHLCPLPAQNPRQSPTTRTDRARSFPCTSIGLKRKTKKRRRDGKETPMEYLSSYVTGGTCYYIPRDHILIISYHRLVCSQLPLQRSLWRPTKPCSRARRTSKRSISPPSPES